MDLSYPYKNEWSVLAWGKLGQVNITHSNGFASDAWPLQLNDGSIVSPVTPVDPIIIVDPTPTPTPTPIGTSEIDIWVANKALPSDYTNDCSRYKYGYSWSSSGSTYKSWYYWGHGCTTETL